MTDTYNDTTGSRKKFLIPLVVLLLCAVSLTGAGYAYNATVTNTGDSVDIDGVTMQLRNSGDTADVTAAMYTLTDVDLATHTTNGYALKYGGDGFYADPSAHSGAVVGPQGVTPIADDFLSGFYVEMYKNNVGSGYQPAIDIATLTNTAAIDAKVASHALFKIGEDYLLKVANQSGAAIKVQADVDATAVLAHQGINEVYLVLKDDSNVLVGIIAASAADFADISAAIANGSAVSYTVEAYIALTDYRSATVPAVDAAALGFSVLFKTVAAA